MSCAKIIACIFRTVRPTKQALLLVLISNRDLFLVQSIYSTVSIVSYNNYSVLVVMPLNEFSTEYYVRELDRNRPGSIPVKPKGVFKFGNSKGANTPREVVLLTTTFSCDYYCVY